MSMSSSEAFQLCPKNIQSSASGLSISYVECNCDSNNSSGPTTLFIHGLDSSSHTWRDIQTSLSTPSIAIDCRGCGKSELGEPNSFSPDGLVEDVKSLVKSHPLLQNNRRFVLVGHSMGGRVAMSYAAKYPKDVSDLVIEDMDMKRRSVASNFIQNFNEEKAIKFERRHNTLDSIKKELESIGYPQDMYTKWINEGRIYKEEEDGTIYSDVNPAFRALCYRTIFDSNNGEESWNTIANQLQNNGKEEALKIHLMVAGIGTVCEEESIKEMRQIIPDLSVKTYPHGTHSIHNSVRGEFMADLSVIISNAT